jgi:hypothetical protein
MGKKDETPGALAGAAEGNTKAGMLQEHDSKGRKSKQQRWRTRHPKSYLAHLTLANALRLGVIERQPCAICGNAKAEAHHPDYDLPLSVIWLCRPHHRAHHATVKGGRNGAR